MTNVNIGIRKKINIWVNCKLEKAKERISKLEYNIRIAERNIQRYDG